MNRQRKIFILKMNNMNYSEDLDKVIEQINQEVKEKIKCRKEYNIKLLEILKTYLEKDSWKDIRFGQALEILGYTLTPKDNIFYEEPVDMYNRVIKTIKQLQ